MWQIADVSIVKQRSKDNNFIWKKKTVSIILTYYKNVPTKALHQYTTMRGKMQYFHLDKVKTTCQ